MRNDQLQPSLQGDFHFPSDNELGIPVLRLDRQADRVDLPFARWGRERRKSRMRGTWHFYTEDYRFSRLTSRPGDLLNSRCVSAVEPNFSIHSQVPYALALHRIYQKRHLARLCQESGIRVFVDLNVASEFALLNLAGVPDGWSAYATRGSAENLEGLQRELELARTRAQGRELLFAVYGGGRSVREFCLAERLLWFAEAQDTERGRGQ